VRFNIEFVCKDDHVLTCDGVGFPECKNISDIRSWINSHKGFINIGERVINLDNVVYIKVKESVDTK